MRRETEQALHHGAPLPPMGPGLATVAEVTYQPVGHFMRYHFGKEGVAVLAIQHRVEAQPAATVVGLAGTLAAQVAPDLGPGQLGVVAPAQLPGSLHPVQQGPVKRRLVEVRQPFAGKIGKRG